MWHAKRPRATAALAAAYYHRRMTVSASDALSAELISLDGAPREVPPFSTRHAGLTPESGYRAAARVHADRLARGWLPIGRKIGFTNRTLWERYGVHEPMWGTVYDRTLLGAANDRVTIPLAGLVQPRIEPEICFKLKAKPPQSANPEDLLASIEWIAHSVEIVHCYHPGWKVTLADCTAANGLHGRLAFGTPTPVARLRGPRRNAAGVRSRTFERSAVVDRGTGANVLGSPLLALAHFIGVLANQPDAPALRAGEIVTTGVLTDAHPVKAGETWTTSLRGLPLPGLTVTFA
jgi:2-oxo-3-hexenedioate decarboxylase